METKGIKSILIAFNEEGKLEEVNINNSNSLESNSSSKENNKTNKKIVNYYSNGNKKEEYFVNEKGEKKWPL